MIAIYSIIGTVLPQGMPAELYAERYPSMSSTITLLQFDRVYSSIVFRALLLLFIVNLVGCTIKILPAQLHRMKKEYVPRPRQDAPDHYHEGLNPEALISLLGKHRYGITRTETGFVASKHRIGNVGASVTHLGIVIIMLGSFFGNMFAQEGFFNMLPGDVRGFPQYGFSLRLDDFYISFREDGSIEQYFSDLTVLETGQELKSKKIWVNNPLKYNHVDFFQASYGWASQLEIRASDGSVLAHRMLRNGESHFYQPEHLTVMLYGFFPDMVVSPAGEPRSHSQQKRNPFYAVIIYHFDRHVGSYVLEPGQSVPYGDLEIVFPDSVLYTGLIFRRDFGYPFVVAGCVLLILGLMFSFYTYPKFIVLEGDSLKAISRQNSWGFNYQLKRLIEKTRI